MNLDQLGRQAGAELRRVSPGEATDGWGLDELRHRDLRKRRTTSVLAVAVAVVVVALTWRAVASVGPPGLIPAGPRPAAIPTPTSLVSPDPVACDRVQQCLGGDSFRLNLPVPVSYTLPPTEWTLTSYTATTADFYSGNFGYGLSVMENPTPAMNSRNAQADPGVRTSAEPLARWLASRPYLVSSPVTATTLSGLRAWQVDVRMKPGQPTVAHCGYDASDACVPLMLMDITGLRTVGIWGDGQIRWTFVDLPGGGTTALWTWDFDNDPLGFARAQPLIDSMRFTVT